MIISSQKDLIKSALNINDVQLTMVSSVKLLRIKVDKKLKIFPIFAKNQQANKCKLKTANVCGT